MSDETDSEFVLARPIGTRLTRPTFNQIYMELAHNIARRSTCYRLQVGCVITSSDHRKVISVGYNGSATGLPNGCTSAEPGNCGCRLHAEINACINCDAPRYADKIVYVTHLPCMSCAYALINLGGVSHVYYATDYRIRDSVAALAAANINLRQLSFITIQGPPLVAVEPEH